MSTSRWDPGDEMISLREAMNSLLEESFARQRSHGVPGLLGLSVDVRELPDRFVLTASVPGVRPEDVEITVIGESVRVRGERIDEQASRGEEGRWLIRERHFGPFDRAIRLPIAVDADATTALFEDGVLTVELPKTQSSEPRVIPVRGVAADPVNLRSDGRS